MQTKLPVSLRVRGLRQGTLLEIGKSGENGKIRYHRFAPSLRVTDLTNAGKRGKRVDEFALYDLDMVQRGANKSEDAKKVFQNVMKFLSGIEKLNYNQALKWAEVIVQDAKQRGLVSPKIEKNKQMGHQILPAGAKKLKVSNDKMSITVDLTSFTISDLTDKNNEPRCINTSRGGKNGPPKLYKWLLANEDKARKMDYHQVLDVLDKLGIKSHSYCAMD